MVPIRNDRYHGSIAEPRAPLLQAVLRFVLEARVCHGVLRIALVGSLATAKPLPKDTDVLVTIEDGLDLGLLARAARRLKGTAQQMNLCRGHFSRRRTAAVFGPHLRLSQVPSAGRMPSAALWGTSASQRRFARGDA